MRHGQHSSRQTHLSTRSPEFTGVAANWISKDGEILALARFPRAAGSRGYRLVTEKQAFDNWLLELKPRTSLILMRAPVLPVRGLLDDRFLQRAASELPERRELLAIRQDPIVRGNYAWYPHLEAEDKSDLIEQLQEWQSGLRIATGVMPDWACDSETTKSAYVPDADGTIHPEPY